MATVIYLACRLPGRSSGLPESRNGPDQSCSLIWPCSRWGLPSQPVTRLLVGSYIKGLKSPHLFTLTRRRYAFCCTFPILVRGHSLLRMSAEARATFGRWALPTTASCGARTFLSPVGRQRHR